MRIAPAALLAACLLAAPAAAQPSDGRLAGCDPMPLGLPLVGTVTDAQTGRPLPFAQVQLDTLAPGWADRVGCFSAIDLNGGGRQRVRVSEHRYVSLDTVLELSPEGGDTVHLALQPGPPGCCRLEGEWAVQLSLDSIPLDNLRPRARTVGGRMAFSPRLPAGFDHFADDDPRYENGRFDIDLSAFFGGPYASDVSTTVVGALTDDVLRQATGEVYAHDSVQVMLIPRMSHGGLLFSGVIRGDTVRGTWVQNAYCCGAGGAFVMHRVPPSPAGDSLVERGVRAMEAERIADERAEAARALRVGRLRLRVWDEGTGRYVKVAFAAEGHADNPGGGTSSIAYASGEDGWGPVDELEPGRYDLLVYEFTCDGDLRMGNWVDPGEATPRWTVTIESGGQVDLDIRMDVCALPEDDELPVIPPVAVPVPG